MGDGMADDGHKERMAAARQEIQFKCAPFRTAEDYRDHLPCERCEPGVEASRVIKALVERGVSPKTAEALVNGTLPKAAEALVKSPIDQKEGLTSARKPDLTHMRQPPLVYNARACEYGTAKGYDRGNYLRPMPCLREDFLRLRGYLRAVVSHAGQILDALEAHQAIDPKLEDEIGMRRAAYSEDTDPDQTGRVGPSFLPHACGLIASVNMAITQATRAGLLPEDPGQPWVSRKAPK